MNGGATAVLLCLQVAAVISLCLFFSKQQAQHKASLRSQRWLRRALPILLVCVALEMFAFRATFRLSGRQAASHGNHLHEVEGSRWDLMDCINQNQDSARVRALWGSAGGRGEYRYAACPCMQPRGPCMDPFAARTVVRIRASKLPDAHAIAAACMLPHDMLPECLNPTASRPLLPPPQSLAYAPDQ